MIAIKRIDPIRYRYRLTGDIFYRTRLRIAYMDAKILKRRLTNKTDAINYGYSVGKRYLKLSGWIT